MPRPIRHLLFEKIKTLPEWQKMQEAFLQITSLNLQIADEYGRTEIPVCSNSSFCHKIATSLDGRTFCEKFRLNLISKSEKTTQQSSCELGWEEIATPLRINEENIGFLFFHGFRNTPFPANHFRKIEKILTYIGLPLSEKEWSKYQQSTPIFSPSTTNSYLYFLELAAQKIVTLLVTQLSAPPKSIPLGVRRACLAIQQEALGNDIRLPEIAKQCGMSEGHLSRLFHKSMGMRFSEYVARLRADCALNTLQTSSQTITEIAFASGFQSISQFHRIFRQLYKMSPREFRKQHALTNQHPENDHAE